MKDENGEPVVNTLILALVEAHQQVDVLLAMLLRKDKSFRPSQLGMWPEIVKRAELIQKYWGSP